jgi:hypothetical protein
MNESWQLTLILRTIPNPKIDHPREIDTARGPSSYVPPLASFSTDHERSHLEAGDFGRLLGSPML